MTTHSSILAWKTSMDRGPWQAIVHRVTKSQTRLSDSHTHRHTHTHTHTQHKEKALGGTTNKTSIPTSGVVGYQVIISYSLFCRFSEMVSLGLFTYVEI